MILFHVFDEFDYAALNVIDFFTYLQVMDQAQDNVQRRLGNDEDFAGSTSAV